MMKIKKQRGNVLYCGLAALVALASVAEARDKKTKDRLYLDERDVLQIEYRVDVDPQLQFRSPSLADSTQEWKERMFERALYPMIELADFPMGYVYLEENEQPAKGEPALRFYALRWEQTHTGEIEAVLQVNLHAYGYRYRVGTYRNTEYPPLGASRDRLEAVYIKAMTESLKEAINDLLPSFEEPPAPGEG